MTVIAKDLGQRNGEYWVNVRNAEPKGMIGDAGVIRRFNDKSTAQNYIEQVNKTGVDVFVMKKEDEQSPLPLQRHEGDTFESAQKE